MKFLDKLKLRLIEDWKTAWKFWSVQLVTLGVIAQTVWAALPSESRALIPSAEWIGIGLGIAALIARLFTQEKKDG